MNNQSPIYCENGLQYTLNEEGAFIYRYEGDDEKLVIQKSEIIHLQDVQDWKALNFRPV